MFKEELEKEIINLKNIDIEILKIFNNLKPLEYTGTKLIAEYLFNGMEKCGLRAKEKTIDYRIKKLSPNFIKVEKDGKRNIYTFRGENVKFSKHRFSSGKKSALILKSGNKELIIEI